MNICHVIVYGHVDQPLFRIEIFLQRFSFIKMQAGVMTIEFTQSGH